MYVQVWTKVDGMGKGESMTGMIRPVLGTSCGRWRMGLREPNLQRAKGLIWSVGRWTPAQDSMQ